MPAYMQQTFKDKYTVCCEAVFLSQQSASPLRDCQPECSAQGHCSESGSGWRRQARTGETRTASVDLPASPEGQRITSPCRRSPET
jgi:hypothetical protein